MREWMGGHCYLRALYSAAPDGSLQNKEVAHEVLRLATESVVGCTSCPQSPRLADAFRMTIAVERRVSLPVALCLRAQLWRCVVESSVVV